MITAYLALFSISLFSIMSEVNGSGKMKIHASTNSKEPFFSVFF